MSIGGKQGDIERIILQKTGEMKFTASVDFNNFSYPSASSFSSVFVVNVNFKPRDIWC